MSQLQFTTFSSLPTELRWQIWEDALYQETKNQTMVIQRFDFVFPTQRHVSPLLATNRESRERAKAFYNFVLDVTVISPIRPPPRFSDRLICLGQPAGVLRLNIERTTFIISLTLARKVETNQFLILYWALFCLRSYLRDTDLIHVKRALVLERPGLRSTACKVFGASQKEWFDVPKFRGGTTILSSKQGFRDAIRQLNTN
ncbi:hypothetical protein F5Y02DRAFT_428803 [Annulohypoxylon stygium]|nr:hypothetical protein F5Y02DRAFT_428803 [Annulohypoxylon stygium]